MILLTQKGEEFICDTIHGQQISAPQFIGWGTGTGTIDKGNTDIFGGELTTRVIATRSQLLSNTLRWAGTIFAIFGPRTITNVGLFSSPTPMARLIMHGDHPPIVLATGDGIQYLIDLTLTGANEDLIAIEGVVIPGGG